MQLESWRSTCSSLLQGICRCGRLTVRIHSRDACSAVAQATMPVLTITPAQAHVSQMCPHVHGHECAVELATPEMTQHDHIQPSSTFRRSLSAAARLLKCVPREHSLPSTLSTASPSTRLQATSASLDSLTVAYSQGQSSRGRHKAAWLGLALTCSAYQVV